MKTTPILIPLTIAGIGLVAFSTSGCNKSAPVERGGVQAHQYTCPMHPEVVKPEPGNCPKCGMKLVEKQ